MDLNERVAELVAKEEKIACRSLAAKKRRTNWCSVFLLLVLILGYFHGLKTWDCTKNIWEMIRFSQISWGGSVAKTSARRVSPDGTDCTAV